MVCGVTEIHVQRDLGPLALIRGLAMVTASCRRC